MHKKTLGRIIWLPLLASCYFFFSGCGNDFIYEEKLPIPADSWAYEDTLAFKFSISDTTKIYALLLDVTHSPEYGFQNLYVQIHTRYPNGKVEQQVLSLELANQAGIWNGQCSGKSCTLEIPLLEKAVFRETGNYSLTLEQYMRESPIPGVKDMALKIKPIGMR